MYSFNVTAKPRASGMVSWGESVEEGLRAARDYAALMLSNEASRTHVEIRVEHVCADCRGNGRVALKNRRRAYRDCRPCKGAGFLSVAHEETVTR